MTHSRGKISYRYIETVALVLGLLLLIRPASAAAHHLSWTPPACCDQSGSQEALDQYSTVSVNPGVQRFSVIKAERVGTPIVYAFTMPSTALHPAAAASFAAALINATGEGRQNWPAPLSPVEHTL